MTEQVQKGVLIAISDEASLHNCLSAGVFGQYMKPQPGDSPNYTHYRVLADYACLSPGDMVFFVSKRRFIFGGEVTGPADGSSVYLNGPTSPLGRASNAPLVWDESVRSDRGDVDQPGVFEVQLRKNTIERCQPFLVQFEDTTGMKGAYIPTDWVYAEFSRYDHPVPSNQMKKRGMCILTPGETECLLRHFDTTDKGQIDFESAAVQLTGKPTVYTSDFGVSTLSEVTSEAHLEAMLLLNPELLDEAARPRSTAVTRQFPLCPHRPNVDRVDIAYFEDGLYGPTIPDRIIELKYKERIGKGEAEQIRWYFDWLDYICGFHEGLEVIVIAPSYASTFDSYFEDDQLDRLTKYSYSKKGGT